MRFGIEGPRGGGIAQRRDCFGVASLPGERHPQIKGRVRIIWSSVEHSAKRPLGIGELFPLEVLPSCGEARVDGRDGRRPCTPAGSARKRSHCE
jgi:hypothetical protein